MTPMQASRNATDKNLATPLRKLNGKQEFTKNQCDETDNPINSGLCTQKSFHFPEKNSTLPPVSLAAYRKAEISFSDQSGKAYILVLKFITANDEKILFGALPPARGTLFVFG